MIFLLCAADSYPRDPPPDEAQPSQGGPEFTDGSGPLFSMYLERAEDYDRKMTGRWKADADGILVFVSALEQTLLFIPSRASTRNA